ncbi:hypothetical protein [Sphingobacterium paucimobilis]|nr:hypothetical protein [Sphingobacterium paucimobilis]
MKGKMATQALIGFVVTIFYSCGSPSSPRKNELTVSEFDLPAFFQQEIKSLDISKPTIRKTVSKDSISESKELQIGDWERELASFLTVDLNKPAYRGTYQKDSIANTVTYTFTDSTVDLSVLKIVYTDQIPVSFTIKKSTNNLLYNTSESLEYIKGKRYIIDKVQSVKMLGNRHYRIEGIIE